VRVRRLFVTGEELRPEGVVFSAKHAHYLQKVLRLKSGDLLEVLDGRNRLVVRLDTPAEGRLTGRVLESHSLQDCTESSLVLAFACIRPGPAEEILRHGTELGVTRFVPILSRRSMRRPIGIRDRWISILEGAAAQSRRTRLPVLCNPQNLTDFLASLQGQQVRLLLSTQPDALPILACLESCPTGGVVLLTGPEGGFDASEESEALQLGFTTVSLGSGVLRSETAAIVAAATVMMWQQWREHAAT